MTNVALQQYSPTNLFRPTSKSKPTNTLEIKKWNSLIKNVTAKEKKLSQQTGKRDLSINIPYEYLKTLKFNIKPTLLI